MNSSGHIAIKPKVSYPGTPVVLLCTQNPDGSINISPASAYWALGQILVLGLLADGQTAADLHERPAPVLVLVGSDTKPFFTTSAQHVVLHVPNAQVREIPAPGTPPP